MSSIPAWKGLGSAKIPGVARGEKTSRIQSFVPEALRYVPLTVLPLTLYASEEAARLSRLALVCGRVSTHTIRIRVIEVSGT
jgi:hypothetical protein